MTSSPPGFTRRILRVTNARGKILSNSFNILQRSDGGLSGEDFGRLEPFFALDTTLPPTIQVFIDPPSEIRNMLVELVLILENHILSGINIPITFPGNNRTIIIPRLRDFFVDIRNQYWEVAAFLTLIRIHYALTLNFLL